MAIELEDTIQAVRDVLNCGSNASGVMFHTFCVMRFFRSLMFATPPRYTLEFKCPKAPNFFCSILLPPSRLVCVLILVSFGLFLPAIDGSR